tara:strand:- start:6332 stop:6778 length:447 start_codon:yes stop_codon:yes gene_type:complete
MLRDFFLLLNMSNFQKPTLQDQKSLLSDLILMAKADDKITQGEFDFIHRLAARMGISEKEVRELYHNPLPTKKTFTELERITHFHKMVLLMNVDGETHEKEIAFLRGFGLELGLRPGAINQVLVAMERYEHKIIPPEKLLQIFNTYYN